MDRVMLGILGTLFFGLVVYLIARYSWGNTYRAEVDDYEKDRVAPPERSRGGKND